MTKSVLALTALVAIGFPGAASAVATKASTAKADAAPVASEIILAQSTTNNGARGGGQGLGNGNGNAKGQGATRNNANGRF
jgi:hypothetical protein